MSRQYYVYILANESRMLYVGVTNDLDRRVDEHKQKLVEGYTKNYDLTRLVYSEAFVEVNEAIAWEKRLKGWRRSRKVAMIEAMNPRWRDLAKE